MSKQRKKFHPIIIPEARFSRTPGMDREKPVITVNFRFNFPLDNFWNDNSYRYDYFKANFVIAIFSAMKK